MTIDFSLHYKSFSTLVDSFCEAASTMTVIQMLQKQLVTLEMQDETLKLKDNSMQNALKVTHFQSDRLPVQRKSNLPKVITAIVVILPQALVFAAASGIEAKTELYTAVGIVTVLVAWLISRSLHKPHHLT